MERGNAQLIRIMNPFTGQSAAGLDIGALPGPCETINQEGFVGLF